MKRADRGQRATMAMGPLLWPCPRSAACALTSCQASSVVMATRFSVKRRPLLLLLPLSPSSSSLATSLQVGVKPAQQGGWNARHLLLLAHGRGKGGFGALKPSKFFYPSTRP